MVSTPITSLPSGSKKGKVAVSQGIVEDESDVHIQLIERELHKLREEIKECKMNLTTHNNTNDSQHDCSRLENLFTFQKFNKFTGSSDEDFLLWFEDFNAAIACSTLNEIEKINKFKFFLSGEARYTVEGFHTDTVNTLEKAGERMKNVFAFARDPQDWIVKLNEVKKSNSEPIRVFAYRVNRMVTKAFPDAGEISRINLAVDYFLRGLQAEIGNKVRLLKPKTLEFAIEKAEINEKTLKLNTNNGSKNLNVISAQDQTDISTLVEPYKNDINNRLNQLKDKINAIENKTKNMNKNVQSIDNDGISEKLNMLLEGQKKWELSRQNKYNNREQKTKRNIIECYHCKKLGHTYYNCFFATPEDKQKIQNNLKGQGQFSNSPETILP
jgi:hypothetical protein